MAIKILITLDGSEKIEEQLKKLGTTGEQAMQQIGKSMPDLELKLPNLDSRPIEELNGHTNKLSEAFRILRPLLRSSGVQIGEFGAFARVASISIVAFGAVAAGAAAVGLGRLEESTKRTKGELSDLFGSRAKGEQAFKALNEQAKQFGSSIDSLVPGLEAYQRALDATATTAKGFVALKAEDLPGGSPTDLATVTKAYENFIKILRAGRLSQDDAAKSAKAFFDAFKAGGPLTVEALQNLPTGTIQLLADALGRAGTSTKTFFEEVRSGNIKLSDINKALANFDKQAQSAFDAKAVKTMGDEVSRVLASLNEGFRKLAGIGFSQFIINQLTKIRETIDFANARLEAFFGLLDRIKDRFPKVGALVDTLVSPQGVLEERLKQGIGGAFAGTTEQIQQIWEGVGVASADAYRKGFVNAPALKEINKTLNDTLFKSAPTTAGAATTPKPAEAIKQDFDAVIVAMNTSWDVFTEQINTPIPTDSIFAGWQFTLDAAVSAAQSAYDRIKAIFSQPISLNIQGSPGSFESGGAPFARGGMVRGAGSTTSDSILAFLSNREFVINAKAVTHYGADLFAALNAMRLPRDFINRFNMGGMVRAATGNHFASGGLVAAGNPVILNIDRQSFAMSAGHDTIKQLKRFAVSSQLSSTGRKPRWVK